MHFLPINGGKIQNINPINNIQIDRICITSMVHYFSEVNMNIRSSWFQMCDYSRSRRAVFETPKTYYHTVSAKVTIIFAMMTSSNGNIFRFVRKIHRSPVNSPHKGQWRGVLMFSLIWVSINGWVINRETGHLRRYHAHYDVNVIGYVMLALVILSSRR